MGKWGQMDVGVPAHQTCQTTRGRCRGDVSLPFTGMWVLTGGVNILPQAWLLGLGKDPGVGERTILSDHPGLLSKILTQLQANAFIQFVEGKENNIVPLQLLLNIQEHLSQRAESGHQSLCHHQRREETSTCL